MKVKLKAVSEPVDGFDESIGNVMELIAFCARVSNPANQNNSETSERLLKYLLKHKHWSPLEMASATLEIETTRDIARQLLRHRSFFFQEFSQRYSEPSEMGDAFELREARLQHPTNRQASIDIAEADGIHSSAMMELEKMWLAKQSQVIHEAKMAYNWAIENGIAKEQARVVLPEGNTKSRLYVNGTIRSWIHYIEVRTEEGTQKEHRLLAKEVAHAISRVFPMAEDFIQ